MARALVTGGAGFIGAHLVGAWVRRGVPVRVLDNFSTGRVHHLTYASGRPLPTLSPGARWHHEGVEVWWGDIRDPETCRDACRGVEVVFHQAAVRAVPRPVDDPAGTHEVNATGTLHLLRAALAAGVRRVVYASSAAYGGDPTLPRREHQCPAPVSPYGASKLAGEAYCRAFARTYGLSTVSLRYFNVFGPLQDPHAPYAAVIPRFAAWTLVGASLRAAEVPDLFGEVFNVAGGERRTLLEVAEAVECAAGRRGARRHGPPRPGDVRHTLADITQARERLGYEPVVRFAEGIARTVAYVAKAASPR